MKISVEGNIGAGKSTVFDTLQKAFPEYECFREPLHLWGDYVMLFYEDPKVWSLPFSLKVLVEFSKQVAPCRKGVVQISERSPTACYHVFTTLLKDDGVLNAQQWDLFRSVYNILGWTPDAIVYVDTPPDTCLERIQRRGRPYELSGVDIVYLKRLDYQYTKLLSTLFPDIPRIRIDGRLSCEEVGALAVKAVAQLAANHQKKQ